MITAIVLWNYVRAPTTQPSTKSGCSKPCLTMALCLSWRLMNRKGQPHGPSPHHKGGVGYGKIPWDEAMNLPGSQQVGLGKKLFEQFPWQQFQPHPEWAAIIVEALEPPAELPQDQPEPIAPEPQREPEPATE